MIESACDVGTALLYPTDCLFFLRLCAALAIQIYGATSDSWWRDVSINTSLAFILLAICSLCVWYDYAPPRIFAYFVEAFYFAAASLKVASLFNVIALSALALHFYMAPRVRVRAVYITFPLLAHVPNIVDRYSRTGSLGHYGNVIGEFVRISAVSLFVFTLTKMNNFKESRLNRMDPNEPYAEIS